jgi:hypothetical protein
VIASWDAATKTAKENVSVLKYYANDVPGSILFNVTCDADPWIDPLNAFIHGQHVMCHGGVWDNDTPYTFTLDSGGFPTFGYPLTRGLGTRVAPEFPPGQGQPASNQPLTTAPVIASPAPGETVDTKFLLLVKHPQYTGKNPVAYSSAILQAEASTSSGWQPVALMLPRILDFASVKLDTETAVTLRPGQYRVRA